MVKMGSGMIDCGGGDEEHCFGDPAGSDRIDDSDGLDAMAMGATLSLVNVALEGPQGSQVTPIATDRLSWIKVLSEGTTATFIAAKTS
jgi:hypothetical protein